MLAEPSSHTDCGGESKRFLVARRTVSLEELPRDRGRRLSLLWDKLRRCRFSISPRLSGSSRKALCDRSICRETLLPCYRCTCNKALSLCNESICNEAMCYRSICSEATCYRSICNKAWSYKSICNKAWSYKSTSVPVTWHYHSVIGLPATQYKTLCCRYICNKALSLSPNIILSG